MPTPAQLAALRPLPNLNSDTAIIYKVTGHFTGTTDEILQWAAAKWGVPDNMIRTVAFMESAWHQANYGDYVDNPAKCPPGYSTLPCPVTFGSGSPG